MAYAPASSGGPDGREPGRPGAGVSSSTSEKLYHQAQSRGVKLIGATVSPTVGLVHGAFAESASWNGVIARLSEHGLSVIAAANPLRSLSGDADVVAGLVSATEGPTSVRTATTRSSPLTCRRSVLLWTPSRGGR